MNEHGIPSVMERAKIRIREPWRVPGGPTNAEYKRLRQYAVNAYAFDGRYPGNHKPFSARVVSVEAVPKQWINDRFYGTVRFDIEIGKRRVGVFFEPEAGVDRQDFATFAEFREKHGENGTHAFFSEHLLKEATEKALEPPASRDMMEERVHPGP